MSSTILSRPVVSSPPLQPVRTSQIMDERFYRFAVKCDKARLSAIEAAARKAGMTPAAFVQAHFETVLSFKTPAAESDASKTATPEDIAEFAHAHDVSRTAARLWLGMEALADGDGRLLFSRNEMVGVLGLATASSGAADKQLQALKNAGLLETLRFGNGKTPTLWRVIRPGGAR